VCSGCDAPRRYGGRSQGEHIKKAAASALARRSPTHHRCCLLLTGLDGALSGEQGQRNSRACHASHPGASGEAAECDAAAAEHCLLVLLCCSKDLPGHVHSLQQREGAVRAQAAGSSDVVTAEDVEEGDVDALVRGLVKRVTAEGFEDHFKAKV